MKKLTLKEMHLIAEKKEGFCLSKEYINNAVKLTWKCKCGKIWKASPQNIKSGRWCSRCAKCEKYNIEKMKEIALERKGICLSKIYKNVSEKLKWKCNICGRVWFATAHNIIHGTWCPRCSKCEKSTISNMKKLARSKNGECLSKKYVSVDTHLLWKCNKCGYKWKASPYHIKFGTWCPQCAGSKKKTLKDMKKLARNRDGKCLSTKYINCLSNLLWKCEICKNTWEATPANIQRGTWCPYCRNKHEEMCRKVFENIFMVKFLKVRPEWLINKKTGRKLELDGFNKELKIAFEYNGAQHYMSNSLYPKTELDLKECSQRDRIKKKLCKKVGVKLIVIPPLMFKYKGFPYITIKTLENYILSQLF